MPPRLQASVSTITTSAPTIYNTCSSCLRREFSSTPAAKTRLRRRMFAWLDGPGENFRHPLPNATNYLTSYDRRGNLNTREENDPKPFPLNPLFISQSILSESLRLEIWRRVKEEGKSVRQVSVELGVEMRRVGAVVRLVEVERRMRAEVRTTPKQHLTTFYDEHSKSISLPDFHHGDQKTNYNSLSSNSDAS